MARNKSITDLNDESDYAKHLSQVFDIYKIVCNDEEYAWQFVWNEAKKLANASNRKELV